MGAMSRAKGATAEREVAAIIRDISGFEVRRRVRQHDGDSDLVGVPGWSIEVKRHKVAKRHDVAAWWAQTVRQASGFAHIPVLLYRADYDVWRAVFPMAVRWVEQRAEYWESYDYTSESSIRGWLAAANEIGYPQQANIE